MACTTLFRNQQTCSLQTLYYIKQIEVNYILCYETRLAPRLCSSGYMARSRAILGKTLKLENLFMVTVRDVCYIAQLIFCNIIIPQQPVSQAEDCDMD